MITFWEAVLLGGIGGAISSIATNALIEAVRRRWRR